MSIVVRLWQTGLTPLRFTRKQSRHFRRGGLVIGLVPGVAQVTLGLQIILRSLNNPGIIALR